MCARGASTSARDAAKGGMSGSPGARAGLPAHLTLARGALQACSGDTPSGSILTGGRKRLPGRLPATECALWPEASFERPFPLVARHKPSPLLPWRFQPRPSRMRCVAYLAHRTAARKTAFRFPTCQSSINTVNTNTVSASASIQNKMTLTTPVSPISRLPNSRIGPTRHRSNPNASSRGGIELRRAAAASDNSSRHLVQCLCIHSNMLRFSEFGPKPDQFFGSTSITKL